MTLIPRSWPSRPTLAISTRIGLTRCLSDAPLVQSMPASLRASPRSRPERFARGLCPRTLHLVATAPACGIGRTAFGPWDVAPFWPGGGLGGGQSPPPTWAPPRNLLRRQDAGREGLVGELLLHDDRLHHLEERDDVPLLHGVPRGLLAGGDALLLVLLLEDGVDQGHHVLRLPDPERPLHVELEADRVDRVGRGVRPEIQRQGRQVLPPLSPSAPVREP